MAVQYIGDMLVIDGSIDLAGVGKVINLTNEVNPLDTTPLSTTGWTTLIGGNKTGMVDIELMADYDNNAADDTEWGYLGTSSVPKSIVLGSADGSPAYLMNGINLSHQVIGGQVGELAMARVSGRQSGSPVVRGKLLHALTTARTSSSTGTGRQLGAVSATKRLYAALHVTAASGSTPSLTVKIQSDDNGAFSSATDRITFTASTARDYQFSSVAGAITDDYWRISYTISGSGASFNFAVSAGIL